MIYHNSMINVLTIKLRTHLVQTRPDTMQTRHLVSKKVQKWLKRRSFRQGAILIIIVKGHCILCIFLVPFLLFCRFSCLRYFLRKWSHRLLAGHLQCKARLMHCMVLLYCIWRGFEAILIALFFYWYIRVIPQRNQREMGHLQTSLTQLLHKLPDLK